jgi:hypothetical protein
MYAPFARSDYYRASAPRCGQQPTTGLPVDVLAGASGGQPQVVPAFTTDRSTREVPSYAPAASPRVRRRLSSWPPHRPVHPGFGVTRRTITAGVRCGPAHIHQVGAGSTLTELHALVPLVHLLVLLADPAPSGSSGTSRRCQDCLPPLPASPRSGCPQLHGLAATRPRRRSFTAARSRSASRRT